MNKKTLLENNIPFQPAPLTDIPMKNAKHYLLNGKEDERNSVLADNEDSKYDLPMDDTEKIKVLLLQSVSLFKNKADEIKVLQRNKTESGIMYDVYFANGHTILYIKPDEKIIGLVNRNMDKDDFADVLEDIQEITLDDPDKTLGKKLIGVARAEMLPEVKIEEPEEDVELDTDEVESDLNSKIDTNVEDDYEKAIGETPPVEEEPTDEPPVEEPAQDKNPENKEEEPEDKLKAKKEIKKENIQQGRNGMKVKDILKNYGFRIVSEKNDVSSIVEYYENPALRDFSSFIVKVKGNDYSEIYGIYGSRFDEEKEAVQVLKDGKIIYESNEELKNQLTERYETGEIVKIDLSKVESDYLRQIHVLAKRTKGYAIVESIEGNDVRIAESEHKLKMGQSVQINKDALIKIKNIADTCVVYEDKEAVEDYKKLITETKDKAKTNKENTIKNYETEISEDILNAGFLADNKKK